MSPHEWKRLAEKNFKPEDLGEAIAEYRRKIGLTQKEFANKVGISRNLVSNIERGMSQSRTLKIYQ